MMVATIWKALQDYPFFKVSNTGKVLKLNKGIWEECNLRTDKKGYVYVSIRNTRGEWQNMGVHRLVAMAFCKKPVSREDLVVNHLDENPSNNRADNLEYCTQSQNALYSARRNVERYWHKHGAPKYSNPGGACSQYDITGKLIKMWPSIRDAALTLKIPYQHIYYACSTSKSDSKHCRPVQNFWWAYTRIGLAQLVLKQQTNWHLEHKVEKDGIINY